MDTPALLPASSQAASQRTKSVLGIDLRKRVAMLINALSHGHRRQHRRQEQIRVHFKGQKAYTNGTMVVLPAIQDLAEIPTNIAHAMMGYAAHEASHIMHTEFEYMKQQILDASAGKPLHYRTLLHAFCNAIEDYRIERLITSIWPGTKTYIVATRIHIHPAPDAIPQKILADPVCIGPLGLTWTGSQLNRMNIPEVQKSLDSLHPGVRALVETWTQRMQHVKTCADVFSLARDITDELMSAPQKSGMGSSPSQNGQNSERDKSPSPDKTGNLHARATADDAPETDGTGQGQAESREEPRDPRETDRQNGDDSASRSAHDQEKDDRADGDAHALTQESASAATGRSQKSGEKPWPASDGTSAEAALSQKSSDQADGPPPTDGQNAAADTSASQTHRDSGKETDKDGLNDIIDGELDPGKILENIRTINLRSPEYDSWDPIEQDKAGTPGQDGHSTWNDQRIRNIELDSNAAAVASDIRAECSGIISTTALTVRRRLRSTVRQIDLRSKSSGTFDVTNINEIVRETGNCYRITHRVEGTGASLYLLIDASGSMETREGEHTRLRIAMQAAMAIELATAGTPIITHIYAFTGYSPHVEIIRIKSGKNSRTQAMKGIGSYTNIRNSSTPTGEAIAGMIHIMERDPNPRRILVILTDGMADNETLAAHSVAVAERRGIETCAIGIGETSVETWAPRHKVIMNVADLPRALLDIINPNPRRART